MLDVATPSKTPSAPQPRLTKPDQRQALILSALAWGPSRFKAKDVCLPADLSVYQFTRRVKEGCHITRLTREFHCFDFQSYYDVQKLTQTGEQLFKDFLCFYQKTLHAFSKESRFGRRNLLDDFCMTPANADFFLFYAHLHQWITPGKTNGRYQWLVAPPRQAPVPSPTPTSQPLPPTAVGEALQKAFTTTPTVPVVTPEDELPRQLLFTMQALHETLQRQGAPAPTPLLAQILTAVTQAEQYLDQGLHTKCGGELLTINRLVREALNG